MSAQDSVDVQEVIAEAPATVMQRFRLATPHTLCRLRSAPVECVLMHRTGSVSLAMNGKVGRKGSESNASLRTASRWDRELTA